ENRLLLSSAVGAAVTANAWQPVARRGAGSVPAFASGLRTSELPLQALAFQVVLAATVSGRRSTRTLRGKLALALTAASGVGLVALYREAVRSQQVLEDALLDGLGPEYRKRIAEPFNPRPEVELTRTRILAPA